MDSPCGSPSDVQWASSVPRDRQALPRRCSRDLQTGRRSAHLRGRPARFLYRGRQFARLWLRTKTRPAAFLAEHLPVEAADAALSEGGSDGRARTRQRSRSTARTAAAHTGRGPLRTGQSCAGRAPRLSSLLATYPPRRRCARSLDHVPKRWCLLGQPVPHAAPARPGAPAAVPAHHGSSPRTTSATDPTVSR